MTNRQPVQSSAVWKAHDATNPDQWSMRFSGEQQSAIVEAAHRAIENGRTVTTIKPEDFDIPLLAPQVSEWVETLSNGRGFLLLRGFPIDELPLDAIALAYVGLGVLLGTLVGQDAEATVLGHVRDEGIPRTGPGVRIYRTKARQDFIPMALTSSASSVCRRPKPGARAGSPVPTPSTTRSSVDDPTSWTSFMSRCTGIATTSNHQAKTLSSLCPCSMT